MPGKPNTLERVMCRCDIDENGCHIWKGGKDKDGYGIASWKNKSVRVTRLVAELFLGMEIQGKMILHTCDTPSCINPNHLMLGDGKKNADDRDSKGRGMKGKKQSDEHIKKRFESRKGWKHTMESRRLISLKLHAYNRKR